MPTKPLEAELARLIVETIRANQPPAPPPLPSSSDPIPDRTIPGWCEAHNLSRSTLYKMWREGRGPRSYKAGRSRRISHEADLEWRRQAEGAA
jgi:predicted DNA-binding transcriptional regulator AlpA